VTAGTGAAPGVYEVASRLSSDAIALKTSIGAAANGQTNIEASLDGEFQNALPSTAFVKVLFQGARDDGTGTPDPVGPFTGDISTLSLPPGELRYFRVDVEFDLGSMASANTRPISLDFLRVPFVF